MLLSYLMYVFCFIPLWFSLVKPGTYASPTMQLKCQQFGQGFGHVTADVASGHYPAAEVWYTYFFQTPHTQIS